MKKFSNSPLGNTIIILLISIAAITLVYMWTDFLDEVVFFKLLITASLLVVILGLIVAVKRDVEDDNKSKGDRYFN